MRVRTFRDVNQSLAAKGFIVSAQITKKGKPLTILKKQSLDQSRNILFISRDYRGLDVYNEEKTLLPCKAPGIEIIANIMDYLNIGQASILGIYDILDWQDGLAKVKLNPLNLTEKIPVTVLNPAEKHDLVDKFFKSLPAFVEKFNFTGIVFCGGYPPLNNEGNFVTDWTKWGRVWQENGVPATLTVPLNYVSVDRDTDEATNMASLCGFIVDHVRNVLHGDNYYTLDFEGTKTYLVDTIAKFDKFMERLRNTKVSSWDTETTGLSRMCEDILTIQVALNEKTAYVIPYKHPQSTFTADECDYIAKTFKKYFEFEARGNVHIYQNAKYDLNQFYHFCGWKYYSALLWDIMAGEFALEENRKNLQPFGLKPFNLNFFTYNYGGGHIYDDGEVGKEDRNDLSTKDLKDVAEYGAKDVIIPYQIYNFQRDKAKRLGDENFENVVLHVIGDIIYCVTILEQNGEKIDKDYLLSLMGESSDFGKALKKLQDSIYQTKEVQIANDIICEKAGYKVTSGGGLFGKKKWLFDIGKPEHKKILFVDVMKLEADKTDKGNDSIGKDFKSKYKKNPIVASFDKLEKIKKAYSTFIKAHFDRYKTDKDLRFDSRIRSDYMFQKVLTGRISACVTLDSYVNVDGKLLNGYEATELYNKEKREVKEISLLVDTAVGVKQTKYVMYHKNRNVVRFETESGYKVGVDENTPMMTLTLDFNLVWKPANLLNNGDNLCISNYNNCVQEEPTFDLSKFDNIPVIKGSRNENRVYPTKMSTSLARLLGYFCSEGAGLRFWVTDIEIYKDFQKCWFDVFGEELPCKSFVSNKGSRAYGIDLGDKKLNAFFSDLGYNPEKRCWEKCVPQILFKSSKACVLNFLRAFIDGDGSLRETQAFVYSTSRTLLDGIQNLLLRVGVFSHIYKIKPSKNEKWHSFSHLCISGDEFRKLVDLFKDVPGYKSLPSYNKKDVYNSKYGSYPYIMNAIPKTLTRLLKNKTNFSKYGRLTKYKITQDFLNELKRVDYRRFCVLNFLLKQNIAISPIISTRKTVEDVYDFTMDVVGNYMPCQDVDFPNETKEGNYLANGIICHNSNPNLQQMPSRGEFCKIVKRQFVVNPDHFFLKADYSAHEVRNWGNVAGDPNVCQSFDAGKQIRKELRYYFENNDDLLKRFEGFQKETRWVVPKGSDTKQLTYEEKKDLIETIQDKRFKKLCELMFDLENRGDVHKLNYEFFRGVPAAQVTPEQRQSVKGLVFGTIYGRGAKSIAQEINASEKEAQDLMDLMAEKFEVGWQWLVRCKSEGLKTYEVVSPIGRIRHLFSYMNGSPNLIAATDRQGPNSCIQGFSSDVGFASGKIMQDLCWQWFWSRGIDFDFRYCNVVHDSTETEVSLAHLPIALYMIEHSYSTLAHRKLKKLYGLDLVCGYETEADLGVCMAHMETFKSWINFKSIVNESVEWGVKNLPCWSYSEESLKKCFHNYDILDKIRKQELKQTKGEKVDTYMYLNRDNILKIGLEF